MLPSLLQQCALGNPMADPDAKRSVNLAVLDHRLQFSNDTALIGLQNSSNL